jgi:hypothetical protein
MLITAREKRLQPTSGGTTDNKRKRHNARVFARAVGVDHPWSELFARRKIGIALFILGLITLCLMFVFREFVGRLMLLGFIAMGVGARLAVWRVKGDAASYVGDGGAGLGDGGVGCGDGGGDGGHD